MAKDRKMNFSKRLASCKLRKIFLKYWRNSKNERISKVDKAHCLSIKRQCKLLEVCRSSFYYLSQENTSYNEELMKLIDIQYTKTTFYGIPRMVQYLRELGHQINPKRIRCLYQKMDLYAIGLSSNTSKPRKGEGQTVNSYLLRGIK